ncbi:uncharacterized protein ACB058_003056 isoform 4-T4 [Synchiropus picturatus]
MVQLDQPSKHPTKSSTQDSSVPLTTFQMARTKQVPRRGGKNKVPDNQRASPPVTRNANPNTSAEQATREVLSATVPKESVATTSGQENQFVMPDVSEIQAWLLADESSLLLQEAAGAQVPTLFSVTNHCLSMKPTI